MTKKILVTGASGFIGRHSLPILVAHGFDVHAVSLHTTFAQKGVTWHHTNLLDAEARTTLMESVKPTHVLHFAWIATPGVYWTSPLNQHWHEATLDLLALAKGIGAERFVGAGSCAEYDWSGGGHCDENSTPLAPSTPYGKAKAASGKTVIEAEGISTAWGRIFHLYGPHEYPERLVPSVIHSLLKNEKALCTPGTQVRDFLHVQDVASAFVALLESDVRGAVNIASGNPVRIREMVEMIGVILDKPELIALGALPLPPQDPPRLTAEVKRLEREVGWKPSYTLQSGLADACAWWQSQN